MPQRMGFGKPFKEVLLSLYWDRWCKAAPCVSSYHLTFSTNTDSRYRAAWAFSEAYKSGKIKEGEEFRFYAAFSPDKTSWLKSLGYHVNAYYTAKSVFFRGGMMYYMKLTGNTLQVRVVDSYNIASGVTRDSNTNIERLPNQVTPLGNTFVEFYFEYKNIDPNK